MMKSNSLYLTLLLLTLATTTSASYTCISHCERTAATSFETLSQAPSVWTRASPPTKEETVRVLVGVRQPASGVAALNAKFLSVSDPCHPEYKAYWSVDELVETIGSSPADLEAVEAFLRTAGALSVETTVTRDWLEAVLPVPAAEAAFGVTLEAFEAKGIRILRTLSPVSVPAELGPLVRVVTGLTAFPLLKPAQPKHNVALGAPKVTPQLLWAHYNVTEPAPTGTNITVAVSEFEGQRYDPIDLKKFQSDFKLLPQAVTKDNSGSGLGHTEANLDIQYIMAMAQGLDSQFWLDHSLSFNLVKWLQEIIEAGDISQVWSTSYGEAIETVSVEDAHSLDQEQKKAASLGVSLIYASGDSGVYSRGKPQTSFYPTYPASLPSNTAVGATQMTSSGDENSAVDWSGGGFSPSSYFVGKTDAPWQAESVAHYFASGVTLPPSSKYDANGVGFPDMSALGVGFEVVMGLIKEPVDGTSCASPTAAGIFGLVNAHLAAANMPPLGFINPLLYKAQATAFRDITMGKNSDNTPYGFEATTGWDPLSGVGVIDFPKFLEVAKNPSLVCDRN